MSQLTPSFGTDKSAENSSQYPTCSKSAEKGSRNLPTDRLIFDLTVELFGPLPIGTPHFYSGHDPRTRIDFRGAPATGWSGEFFSMDDLSYRPAPKPPA